MAKRVLVLGLVGLAIFACRPGQSGEISPSPSGRFAVTPMPASQESDTPPEPPDTMITYTLSGGFAGVVETWTIRADGRVEAPDGRILNAPQEVSQLLDALEAAGFFNLEGDYLPKDTCCDRFWHEFDVQIGDRRFTITTIDDTPQAPTELVASLRLVQEFIAQNSE